MPEFSLWLGICHLHRTVDTNLDTFPALVAAWADSVEGFEREVHFHTNTHGLQMILAEDVLPAAEWMAKHPNRKDAQRLAGKVSAKHPVEIGALGGGASGADGQPDDTEGYLHIEEVEGVEPLDSQFGVHPPKTVPDALYEPLFGQPDPTPAEEAQYGSADKVPSLHTYAILDAAKVVNFVEMLEASGLEHRCLFKGDAAEEMRDVAPYVVQLEEGNDFTRNLFSKDPEQEVPWFMWDREPGIYIRSRGSLDDMRKHFRKFTKVQDENRKWYYQRLYDPKNLVYYLDGIKMSLPSIQRFFSPSAMHPISSFVTIVANEGNVARIYQQELMLRTGTTSHSTNDTEILTFDARYTEDFLKASINLLRKYTPELQHFSDKELMLIARKNIRSFHQFNLISKPVVANVLAVITLSGRSLTQLPTEEQYLLQDAGQSQFRSSCILLQHIKQRVIL